MAEMERRDGAVGEALRRRLAAAAFARSAAYDAAIARWLGREEGETLPPLLTLAGRRRQTLRYGENPHQKAALYAAIDPGGGARPGVATARQLQGKELSFNNLADAARVGVLDDDLAAAYARALACDPVSA